MRRCTTSVRLACVAATGCEGASRGLADAGGGAADERPLPPQILQGLLSEQGVVVLGRHFFGASWATAAADSAMIQATTAGGGFSRRPQASRPHSSLFRLKPRRASASAEQGIHHQCDHHTGHPAELRSAAPWTELSHARGRAAKESRSARKPGAEGHHQSTWSRAFCSDERSTLCCCILCVCLCLSTLLVKFPGGVGC